MWLYYEDKGMYLGMTKTKHNLVKDFVEKAVSNGKTINIKSDIKLPNFHEKQNIEVIFDIPSMCHKVNLDCLNCHRVHTGRSCCAGVPYSFDINHIVGLILDGSLIPYVRKEFRGNLELCKLEKDYHYVYSDKKKTFIPAINDEGITECPMRGYDRCGLHAYMLANNIPYYMKPCTWLYPLELLMELDNDLQISRMLILVQCERTSRITRWGESSYHRHCLDMNMDKYLRDNDISEAYHQIPCDKSKYFRNKDYKEVYKCFETELTYILGSDVVKAFLKKIGGVNL